MCIGMKLTERLGQQWLEHCLVGLFYHTISQRLIYAPWVVIKQKTSHYYSYYAYHCNLLPTCWSLTSPYCHCFSDEKKKMAVKSRNTKIKRGFLIGLATVVGGTVIGKY